MASFTDVDVLQNYIPKIDKLQHLIISKCLVSNFVNLSLTDNGFSCRYMPLISIIIPSFNNLNLLRECIDSIKNQTFADYEVFIIDAKSSDGTIEYLQTLNKPFQFISGPDRGVYDAMNKGIAMSNGEWLYFLGTDDVLYHQETLQSVFCSKIEDDESLVIGQIKYKSNPNESKLLKSKHILFSPWSPNLWIRNAPHHQGIFYRKTVFANLQYDLKYKILSDYDLNLKLYKNKLKAKILNQTIALCGGEGISKRFNWQLYKEEIELKTNLSSSVLKPVFYVLGFGKYLLKKIT